MSEHSLMLKCLNSRLVAISIGEEEIPRITLLKFVCNEHVCVNSDLTCDDYITTPLHLSAPVCGLSSRVLYNEDRNTMVDGQISRYRFLGFQGHIAY